jgi:hypothetical protein
MAANPVRPAGAHGVRNLIWRVVLSRNLVRSVTTGMLVLGGAVSTFVMVDRRLVASEKLIGAKRHSSPSLTDMFAWEKTQVFAALVATEDAAERPKVVAVTEGFFPLHFVRPALGRDFRVADTLRDAEKVAILSDAFWADRFHRDDAAVGTTFQHGGSAVKIIGVAPKGFGGDVEAWVAMSVEDERSTLRDIGRTFIGRLSAGRSIEEAEQRLVSAIRPTEPEPRTGLIQVHLIPRVNGPIAQHHRAIAGFSAAVVLFGLVYLLGFTKVSDAASARPPHHAGTFPIY